MSRKQRLSASVDADLIEAAEHAVARGVAASVSGWVNEALRLKLDHERRLEALAAFVAAYEAEYGRIAPEEMRQATRRASARAVAVRGIAPASRVTTRRRRHPR
jgi:Arc/MetJ-type ribon-helix-helix transcriptional regulator